MRKFGWQQSLIAAAFVLFVLAGIFFAVRAMRPAMYWHRHKDEQIESWMSVGYVAHSYHVPPHVLTSALGLAHRPPDKRPLGEIARSQNRSMDEIRTVLLNAIVHARPPYPPPSPDPGRSP
jgi:ABC-type nickel/cobalt efflux system permease component RcnA